MLNEDALTVDNVTIAELDPLGADALLAHLPAMNRAADTAALIAGLQRLAPSHCQVDRFSRSELAAAMRDLGMFLGSLRRHEVQPFCALPALAETFVRMGAAAEMVPRDTVYHYGCWNPRGPRERLYLGDERERVLVEAVRVGATACSHTVDHLLGLQHEAVGSPSFLTLCSAASDSLAGMASSAKEVHRMVSPHFFANEVRPYFQSIDIAGVTYAGPAAANLPLGVVDHLLWSSACDDSTYRDFQRHLLTYGLPHHVRLVRATGPEVALSVRCERLMEARAGLSADVRAGIEAVQGVLNVMLRFRGRHMTLATAAYQPGVRLFDKGSGGYEPAVLSHVLELTLDVSRRLQVTSP